MRSIESGRQAIRPLLNGQDPADASAIYYAFYHPKQKVQLRTYPADSSTPTGYICLAMTGIDLFRPVITLRLPSNLENGDVDPAGSMELIYSILIMGSPVIVSAPARYRPILSTVMNIDREEALRLLILDKRRFEPVINVLVSRDTSLNNLPRFSIRRSGREPENVVGDIVASAGINWQSPEYSEIYVHTNNSHRRQGMGSSVVSYLVSEIIESGRIPLYAVAGDNEPSLQLAKRVGFIDTGVEELLLEGSLKARPGSPE